MNNLITKANKSRSPASAKVSAKKGKKSVSKKPQRPGKITAAPKSKKSQAAKSKKRATSAKKSAPKKTTKTRRAVKPPAAKKFVRTKAAARTTKARAGKIAPPPKKVPSPGTLAAVRVFEQALKTFNRQDFSAAKTAFDKILTKFSEQAEIVARARTYLAICEQKLARAPSAPRSTEALYNQGVFEFNRGNNWEAIEFFEKALKAEPRADHVWYSLAAAYARLADAPKAVDALRRAIAIRPVHRSHARRDPDFASLRSNEDFQQLAGLTYDFIG